MIQYLLFFGHISCILDEKILAEGVIKSRLNRSTIRNDVRDVGVPAVVAVALLTVTMMRNMRIITCDEKWFFCIM